MDVTQTVRTASRGTLSKKGSAKQVDNSLAPFYTPQNVAQLLTDWAVVHAQARILDPSYGGCAFLNAALSTLTRVGSPSPGRQIFGVDIDHAAEKYLSDLIDAGADRQQFINLDFFDVEPDYFGRPRFDAVVGNPPYIRYHDIPERLQERAEIRLAEFGIRISGRASYWAFFLLYSIQFIRPGGRLAMVLPGALLHTNYATNVRELLIRNFAKVTIYLLQERIFDGTQEESVILCAEGAGEPNTVVHINQASTVEELAQAFTAPSQQARVVNGEEGDGGWLRALIDGESLEAYDEAAEAPNVIRLGDWAEPRIGVVTGNNDYFILSQSERQERGISESYFIPVIKRPAYVRGLFATNRNLRQIAEGGKDYLLLNPPQEPRRMPKALREYLKEGKKAGVHLACKCESRDPWYVVPQTYVPDAFIPCMSASWPRIIVNRSHYTCTNNIIRLSWNERRPNADWTRLALGTLSTFSQLSAELVGRSYGGGVLKLEPTELTRLAIPLVPPGVSPTLARRVDELLQQNRPGAATEAVDSAILETSDRFSKVKLKLLRAARDKLFMRRRQHRNDSRRIVEAY
jgi:adenine-specific DNA-methyltransferase